MEYSGCRLVTGCRSIRVQPKDLSRVTTRNRRRTARFHHRRVRLTACHRCRSGSMRRDGSARPGCRRAAQPVRPDVADLAEAGQAEHRGAGATAPMTALYRSRKPNAVRSNAGSSAMLRRPPSPDRSTSSIGGTRSAGPASRWTLRTPPERSAMNSRPSGAKARSAGMFRPLATRSISRRAPSGVVVVATARRPYSPASSRARLVSEGAVVPESSPVPAGETTTRSGAERGLRAARRRT